MPPGVNTRIWESVGEPIQTPGYVLDGRMKIRLGDHTDILDPGDSIYFKCSTPHHVTCAEDEPAKILAVMYTGNAG